MLADPRTGRHIAKVFAEKIDLFRQVFARAEDATPDYAGADEAFLIKTRCGRGRLMWAKMCALISRWNLRYKAADMARAMTLQTTMYQRWQAFFEHHDVILTPAITISPRSWRELYPAEIDGQPTRHLFSLAGIGLRGDASRSSGAVTAGRAGPQRDAVRPANRRTA
jgi:amidase